MASNPLVAAVAKQMELPFMKPYRSPTIYNWGGYVEDPARCLALAVIARALFDLDRLRYAGKDFQHDADGRNNPISMAELREFFGSGFDDLCNAWDVNPAKLRELYGLDCL